MMPWGRFQKILDAAIVDADPDQAAARALRARTERDVWATDTEDGLKLLIAKAASGDVTWFMATAQSDRRNPRRCEVTPIRSAPAGRRRSASSPNPPTPSNSYSTTNNNPARIPPTATRMHRWT